MVVILWFHFHVVKHSLCICDVALHSVYVVMSIKGNYVYLLNNIFVV